MGINKGDNVTQSRGQQRAHKLYPDMGKCELCDKPAADIHHKDRNRLHNERANVMFLCRHHHMEEDGRLRQLINISCSKPKLEIKRPCVICGDYYFPLRQGRCHACNEYLRRNGHDRQLIVSSGLKLQKCSNCGLYFELNKQYRKYCPACTRLLYLKRHATSERNRRFIIKSKKVTTTIGKA